MIEDVLSIAKEAGAIIKAGYRSNFEVEFKTNETNLVTTIDKKSEKTIIDFIKKKYPAHSILAEESGETKQSSEYLWVIDPLDGTTNFAHGLPIFSVSIGIQKDGITICGAVYDVMRDAMYSAELGGGAYCNQRKIRVNDNDKLNHSLLVTGFPYDLRQNPDKVIDRFVIFLKKARAVRRLGSAAIDLCYVAEGVFDGFWEANLYPWDVCPGKLLVEEAGGVSTDFNGNKNDIFSRQILATNGKVHQQMIEVMKLV
jgi:myo-inositol-1(or 4)-monophosphatase